MAAVIYLSLNHDNLFCEDAVSNNHLDSQIQVNLQDSCSILETALSSMHATCLPPEGTALKILSLIRLYFGKRQGGIIGSAVWVEIFSSAPTAWRIIPFSKRSVTMVTRVVPFPNVNSWLVNGGYLITYKSWDDPPTCGGLESLVWLADSMGSLEEHLVAFGFRLWFFLQG